MNLYDFYSSKLEYDPGAIASDVELAACIQEILIKLGFLAPPADGKFVPITATTLWQFQERMSQQIPELVTEKRFLGPLTAKALMETTAAEVPQIPLRLGDDLPSRIIKYMQHRSYQITSKPGEYNIVYIEGMNEDGTLNDNLPEDFNDLRLVIELRDSKPEIVGCWKATTAHGCCYARQSSNSPTEAARRLAFGQYQSWRVGKLGTTESYEGLVQVDNVLICQDFDAQMRRIGDRVKKGIFGIHQQHGYDLPRNNIANQSIGCLAGQTRQGHREFMGLIKQDRRYQENYCYCFLSAVISGVDLERQFPRRATETELITRKIYPPTITNALSSKVNVDQKRKYQVESIPRIKNEIEIYDRDLSQISAKQQLNLVENYLNKLLRQFSGSE